MTPQPQPECTTKRILKSRYYADFCVYLEATKSLDATVSSNAFRDTWDRLQHAKMAFEHSRAQLNRHCEEHNCGDLDE